LRHFFESDLSCVCQISNVFEFICQNNPDYIVLEYDLNFPHMNNIKTNKVRSNVLNTRVSWKNCHQLKLSFLFSCISLKRKQLTIFNTYSRIKLWFDKISNFHSIIFFLWFFSSWRFASFLQKKKISYNAIFIVNSIEYALFP
jgi:hypothetical protein